MTYFSTPYKYGKKTAAQIAAITTSTLDVGDNVFNTDINKEEFWTGDQWINDDCVQLTNTQGSTASVGYVAGVNQSLTTSTIPSCALTSNAEDDWQMGVLYRGGANNAKVIIACMGLYKVYFYSSQTTVTRQHIATVSSSEGQAASTGTKSGGTGAVGVIAESFATMPVDRLVNVWVQGTESF